MNTLSNALNAVAAAASLHRYDPGTPSHLLPRGEIGLRRALRRTVSRPAYVRREPADDNGRAAVAQAETKRERRRLRNLAAAS